MKIYILCPRVKSSYSYSLHQLCSHINSLHREAYMFYGPNPNLEFDNIYPEIPRVKVQPVGMIEDKVDNLFIVADPSQVASLYAQCRKIRYAIWWLHPTMSYPLEKIVLEDLHQVPVIHIFPTMYTYHTIRPLLTIGSKVFFLGDSIEDLFVVSNPEASLEKKENVVAYNGRIDQMTRFICDTSGIKCIDIYPLSSEQRKDVYMRAKIFTNFGYDLGKDIYMREAASCGCIVISHKSGATSCKEDVAIEEKISFDTEIPPLISDILNDYQKYYIKQDDFRLGIRSERTEAIIKTQLLLENLGFVGLQT